MSLKSNLIVDIIMAGIIGIALTLFGANHIETLNKLKKIHKQDLVRIEKLQHELKECNEKSSILMKNGNKYSLQLATIINQLQPRLDPTISNKIATSILIYSKERQLDPALVTALIWKESGFNPLARSSKGALGLMQINYKVWSKDKLLKDKLKNPYTLYWVDKNIETGTIILEYYYKACNSNMLRALYAYNSGKRSLPEDKKFYDIPYITQIIVKAYEINLKLNIIQKDQVIEKSTVTKTSAVNSAIVKSN